MPPPLALLRELDAQHGIMVGMANALDWDGLNQTWQATEINIATLTKLKLLSALAPNEIPEARKLLGNLLAQQKFISERVKPWMEQVRPLLDSFNRFPLDPDSI